MRSVTRASSSSAAFAHARMRWRDGRSPSGTPNCREKTCLAAPGLRLAVERLVLLIGLHDPLHQRMAHDVVCEELRECDAANRRQDGRGLDQAALLVLREIDLCHVAGHDG